MWAGWPPSKANWLLSFDSLWNAWQRRRTRTKTSRHQRADKMWRRAASCRFVLAVFLVAALRGSGFVGAASPESQRNVQKGSEIDAVRSIIDGMQGAGARLKHGDTGAGTRQIQQKVVQDIQKLIDAAKPKSPNNNPQHNPGSRQQSGSQSRPQSQQPQGQQSENPGSKPAGTGRPGRKSGEGKPLASDKRGSVRQQRPLFREVWGHLPPALRERTPSDFHEAILPAYDDLVRRYFEALLDSAPSAPNRTAPAQNSPPERSPESPAQ